MNGYVRYACMIVLSTATAVTAADVPAAKNNAQPARARLTLHPAAAPLPALKYRLLPTFFQEQRGNAAPLYAKAMLNLGKVDDQDEERRKLLKGPLAECTHAKVDPLVGDSVVTTVRLAVVREHCDWELPVREQSFVSILLPEIQEIRRLATIVALDGRSHVAERRFDEAVQSLETLYAMARHTAEGPTLIHSLVAAAIQDMADERALELLQQPEAPNLYWARAVLPQPLIDRRRGLAGETHLLDFAWPAWNRMPEVVPTDVEIAAFLDDYSKMIRLAVEGSQEGDIPKAAAVALALLRVTERRKEIRAYLERHGITKARLDGLSDMQLAILHTRLKFDEIRDDSFRWMGMPYPQAKAGLEDATARLKEVVANKEEVLPCASLLMPAVFKVRTTHARSERRMDVLRLLEALRVYAAGHEGRLPKTLDDLQTATPIPHDALTGKPFDYRSESAGATLTLIDEFRDRDEPLVYEIRMESDGPRDGRKKK